MLYKYLKKTPLLSSLYRSTIEPRAQIKIDRILPLLKDDHKILDIGSGNCGVAHLLQQQGKDITCLDIRDLSFYPHIQPVVYDGQTFPFPDQSFDTAMLLTVLHHTTDHETLVQEALRVAKKLIIIEDVYFNEVMRYTTYAMDSLVNLEFFGHPHSNRAYQEWKDWLAVRNIAIEYEEMHSVLKIFKQVTFVCKRKP